MRVTNCDTLGKARNENKNKQARAAKKWHARLDNAKLQQPALQPLCGWKFVPSVYTVRDENTVDTGQEPTKL